MTILVGSVLIALGSLWGAWMLRHPDTRLSRWVDRGGAQ